VEGKLIPPLPGSAPLNGAIWKPPAEAGAEKLSDRENMVGTRRLETPDLLPCSKALKADLACLSPIKNPEHHAARVTTAFQTYAHRRGSLPAKNVKSGFAPLRSSAKIEILVGVGRAGKNHPKPPSSSRLLCWRPSGCSLFEAVGRFHNGQPNTSSIRYQATFGDSLGPETRSRASSGPSSRWGQRRLGFASRE